jgi:hypothetical protein
VWLKNVQNYNKKTRIKYILLQNIQPIKERNTHRGREEGKEGGRKLGDGEDGERERQGERKRVRKRESKQNKSVLQG